YSVFRTEWCPQDGVEHVAVLPDGVRVRIPPSEHTRPLPEIATGAPAATGRPRSSTHRAPLGRVAGARSGDKGGDANLGVWARTDAAYEWLRGFLSVAQLKWLRPECAPLTVHRYELP